MLLVVVCLESINSLFVNCEMGILLLGVFARVVSYRGVYEAPFRRGHRYTEKDANFD